MPLKSMNSCRNIVAILHNPMGYIGLIADILPQLGVNVHCCCPLNGDALPSHRQYDGAIVFGGKMSVNDSVRLPALQDELQWIYDFVNTDKPFLGICLGGQLLARAFGGNVTHHPQRIVEIGYYPLYPTLEGYQDIFANMPERFFQWHNEGFTLPREAIKLAESDLYPNQAFRLRRRAYAFQFHPEATRAQIDLWHQRDRCELQHPGAQNASTQLKYCATLSPAIFNWLRDFLRYWIS